MIEVIDPGPLASVQDPVGRLGWRFLGVPVGGAADPWSARLANRLVGNDEGAALVEVTLGGAALRFDAPHVVAVTGGLRATIGGLALPPSEARRVRTGTALRIDPGGGARAYVAVAGGVAVPQVLGSASTDLRSGFGGLDGRALRPGDRLDVGSGGPRAFRSPPAAAEGPIRVVDGPHRDRLAALLDAAWTVGVEADRAGVRLDGPLLSGTEVASMGLPLGAIQLPPDGRPIVMLADRPVTGGYAVPACVIRADIGRVAQLRTGDAISFVSVSGEEARSALEASERHLVDLEPLAGPDDAELGWIGSHG